MSGHEAGERPFVYGVNLRDWLAGHAPEVPDWFEPTMPPKPEVPPAPGPDHFECECERCAERVMFLRARDRWNEERKRRRLVSWPYAWADLQLDARGQPTGKDEP